jgi:predicted Zn-dependent peptidase
VSPQLLAALLLSAAPAAPAAAPAPAPVHELLLGAPELVVLPVPGARSASLRVVVRAGSAMDPPGQAGLAHLLEHAILDGDDRGHGLIDAARAAGATLDGATERDTTTYLLDAPAEAFGPLAERLLRAVTNPRLDAADLGRQQEVVTSEEAYAPVSQAAARYLETALFGLPEAPAIGTAASRAAAGRDRLLDWYGHHYLTSSITVVLAGAVDEPQARALLRRAFLLPPALPGEEVAARPGAPLLPVTQRIAAPFLAVLHGYQLGAAERPACEPLAALVELRLLASLSIQEPLLSPVEVRCLTLRGADFLVAFGYTATLDAPDLPERVAQVFQDVAAREATPAERGVLRDRLASVRRLVRGDPAALADEAARLAARTRAPGDRPLPPAQVPFVPSQVRAAARAAFQPDRQLSFVLSPFGP